MVDVRFETFGLNAKLLRPPKPMGRIHHHHEIELNYLFRGGVTYLHRWVRHRLRPRRLTVFWGATPHSLLSVEPGSEMAWITLPLPWLLQWGLPDGFIRALIDGQWWTESRPEHAAERYPVLAWVHELASGAEGSHEALLFELRACFLRLAAQRGGGGRTRASLGAGESPALWDKVERMARFMAERFSDEIDVRDVAGAAGLHPKYAMTVFRRATGATIKTFLLQHRITHAQRLLITTDAKVADIAMASGFRSLSAFYNSFEESAGQNPSRFRARTRRIDVHGG